MSRNTLLLLHGEDLTDSSLYRQTLTSHGVTVSSAQSKFGGKSLYFNGSARLLLNPYDFGNSDFTIDWWEYVTSSASETRFASAYTTEASVYGGLVLGYNGTNCYAGTQINNAFDMINGTAMFSNTLNTWVHWAVVRSGTKLTTYRNGTKFAEANMTGTLAYDSGYKMVIGDYRAGDTSTFIGYIDEFRISKVARWTSNFTPPTSAYTVTGYEIVLPTGYRLLTYIQSDGNQYIDTGFCPKYNSRVVMELSGVQTGASSTFLFGTRDTASATAARQFSIYRNGATTIRSDYFGSNATASVSDVTAKTTIDKNANKVTMYGTSVTNTSVSSGECVNSLHLFTMNNAGTPFSPFATFALHSCKIYDGGTLVRDYIPCENAEGEVGLWDNLNGAFIKRSGSGSFIGPETIPPAGDHNTNIGGVAYEIESGTVRYGGAAYEIESGMTLVNGVGYEITFTKPVTVTITGTGDSSRCYVDINGTKYTAAATVSVAEGTTITCYADHPGRVLLNGTTVVSPYSLTVTANAAIQLGYIASAFYGSVKITMPA